MPATRIPLRIIPLGGVGEIGKTMYVFEYGDDIVVMLDTKNARQAARSGEHARFQEELRADIAPACA